MVVAMLSNRGKLEESQSHLYSICRVPVSKRKAEMLQMQK